MAARNLASRYRCTECSAESLKWLGRCASCQAWGTVEELSPRAGAGGFAGAGRCGGAAGRRRRRCRSPRFRPIRRARGRRGCRSSTACSAAAWFPGRWCCWPASPESASPPCCSRSRREAARAGQRVLVVTGEETAAQVQSRAARIGALAETLYLAAETDLGALVTHVEQVAAQPADRRFGADDLGGRGRGRAGRRHAGA